MCSIWGPRILTRMKLKRSPCGDVVRFSSPVRYTPSVKVLLKFNCTRAAVPLASASFSANGKDSGSPLKSLHIFFFFFLFWQRVHVRHGGGRGTWTRSAISNSWGMDGL